MNQNKMNTQQADDVEYYPRLKRAPYIYDGSDFVRSSRPHLGSIEMDVPLNDEGDNSSSLTRTPHKSSSNLQQSPSMKRHSSLLKVFSSLGMSPTPIAEGTGVESQGGGETNPLLLLPRTRRGSSLDVANVRERDRISSRDLNTHKYPQWALHDPASIVMKDGFPVTVGTLIQHHLLLNKSPQQLSPHCIVTPTWRLKERMKTVGVALVLALNIGTDPPGLNKPSPCAKLQCWLDPTSVSRAKAKERIGERLEQQYAKWQQRSKLKYRRAIDPTVDVVKDLCLRMRESAKHERVLFHYNGHGVPRPTNNGEIWLFDRHHTNYIPLSVTDLRRWIGKPSIVVLDCSGAGQLMPYFTSPIDGDLTPAPFHHGSSATMDNSDPSDPLEPEYQAIRDTIVLCPTSQGEWLPLNPELPADVFTSCLTTPIPIALRWFVFQNPLSMEKIDLETIAESIPGKLTDRKTPLGELNWIFTAVTDTIAWNVLPSSLFQRLFRQDLMLASMFRNFLLAERILRSLNCTPVSNPEIPSTCNHPLWDAWDLAVETCLHQLIDQGYLRKTSPTPAPASDEEGDDHSNNQTTHDTHPVTITAPHADSPFFGEQLTAFEIWLEYANTKPKSKLVIRSPPSGGTPLPYLWSENGRSPNPNPHEMDPPVELPIVLQVLLSQAHRVRALVLLKRFLELGPSAVNLALSVGTFPYILKLLQSPVDEYKHVLVSIWARIMSFDSSCQVDVVKDRALSHFIRHLNWGFDTGPMNVSNSTPRSGDDACEQRTMAAFILSAICYNYALGQSESINEKLHLACGSLLQLLEDDSTKHKADQDLSPSFRTWLCICLGNLTNGNAAAQSEVVASGVYQRLLSRLDDDTPDVRAASCYALACIIGTAPIQPLSSLDQPPRPPQELSPTIKSMTGSVSGTFNASSSSLAPNTLTPSFGNASQTNFAGLGLQPIPLASSQPGLNYLVPGNEPSTLFGASMTAAVPPPPEIRTVFDDQIRMNADTHVAAELTKSLNDASPVVRFEATIALNHFIIKYLEGFMKVAGDQLGSSQRSIMGGITPSIPLPSGMNSDAESSFSNIWNQLLIHYRCEPQPSVRSLLSSIVVAVNDRVMSVQSRLRQQRKSRRQSLFSPTTEEGSTEETGEGAVFGSGPRRDLSSYVYGSPQNPIKRSGSIGMTIGTPPQGIQDSSTGTFSNKRHQSTALKFDLTAEELPCAESMFYHWKKVEFSANVDSGTRQRLDLLSDIGAIKSYRSKRNTLVQQKAQLLKDSFAVLAQPQKKADAPYATDVPSEVDKDTEMMKEATHLKQALVLNNVSRGSTSILRFHPYEPALVVCGASDVSCWNATTSEKMSAFINGNNPKNSRITSASWINDATTSLFLTGSSDGSVRIWDGVLEPNDEISREKPTLISSFFAAPNVSSEKGSTGLILQYQSSGGRLIAGGSTKKLHCWDIPSEKLINSFDTGSDAMITTLESAWKHSYRDGYSGLGADIVIAGFSNGVLKLYDTRVNNGAPAINLPGKKRIKQSEFHEHSSWIVDVSFTGFAGRHEVVSGDVSGNIKFWDLRYSSSTRTLNHKMLMTALAVHSNIPLLATGSPAQFIKMVSYDGTTQQVIRYHEKIQGQRLGPVSCLSFHPHMPYLAAGFSDDVVSVYAPKDSE